VSILVVGASVAGIRSATALRGYGYDGALTVLEAESEHPYDKPPLSKDMLVAGDEPSAVALVSGDELSRLGVDLRLGTAALGLDPYRQLVTTTNGEFHYGSLIVATGVRPRTLPGADGLAGIYTLRQARDARALRAALPRVRQVVIIGAGFIGAEVAGAAKSYGCDVTIVEVQPVPLAHLLGNEVGAEVARLHALHNVAVHTGACVAGFIGSDHVEGIVLADGRHLPADLVVVGVGTQPAIEWLAGSGLPVANGLRCDESLRVSGFPNIYAAGDVALRRHPLYGAELRIEHWTNAGELGALAAATIVGAAAPAPQLPYVWSDQYGRRLQIIGRPLLGCLAWQYGGADQDRYVALYADETGTAVGAVAIDDARSLMACRRAIMQRRPSHAVGPINRGGNVEPQERNSVTPS
jgi:NADPH-dependent 2,4-dienoyl-CoA reductase/sulfur reductase-like enzyme